MVFISSFLKDDNSFRQFIFYFFKKSHILPLNTSVAYLFDKYSPMALEYILRLIEEKKIGKVKNDLIVVFPEAQTYLEAGLWTAVSGDTKMCEVSWTLTAWSCPLQFACPWFAPSLLNFPRNQVSRVSCVSFQVRAAGVTRFEAILVNRHMRWGWGETQNWSWRRLSVKPL